MHVYVCVCLINGWIHRHLAVSFRLFLSLHSEEHLSGHGGGHDQGSPSSFSLLRRPPPPPLHGNNCASERDSALETQRESPEGEELYIPSCTIDGQYERVQCYQGYCWCTEKETGKPIPGTSVNGSKPDCSHASPAQPNKSIKGCKGKKKERFLEELMDIFTKNMVKAAQNDSITEPDPEQTIEERAARWEFNLLDKNENRMLDRKEWKIFRRWVSEFRGLRRCGRKLPRFCDVDGDRKISLDEWLACLEAKPDDKKTRKKKPWRKGQNPFQTILKSDRK
ncbi:unnamed protein product [Darwinula stevensoni]|uniref:Uncharacterized protein n=1 Tax=Darwinula stevensoni TaxID=69355 RepID=A0A7R8XMV7_9CRUS|nr:unnamed protein product [Darwinula stevensoni]CAG0896019.1 unnamed protein product [Darwinula stevensoni]